MAERRAGAKRILVAGWFSLERGGATAGDLAALDVTRTWLDSTGYAYDVALAGGFADGVDWRAVPPADYATLVLVCGPVSPRLTTWQLVLRRGLPGWWPLDVSVVDSADACARVAALLARDGLGEPQPDLAFAAALESVPVVGVLRVHPQAEYADGRHGEVDRAIAAHLASRTVVSVLSLRRRSTRSAAARRLPLRPGPSAGRTSSPPTRWMTRRFGACSTSASSLRARELALECAERARRRIEYVVRPQFLASLEA